MYSRTEVMRVFSCRGFFTKLTNCTAALNLETFCAKFHLNLPESAEIADRKSVNALKQYMAVQR